MTHTSKHGCPELLLECVDLAVLRHLKLSNSFKQNQI
jgi:hypothetical protein